MKLKTKHTKILADRLTPVLLYERIRKKYPFSTLLESFDHSSRNNSYSFIGFNRLGYLKSAGDKIECRIRNHKTCFDYPKGEKITKLLEEIFNTIETEEHTFPFPVNGFLGYLSYEAALKYHKIKHSASGFPEIYYQLYENFIVFDHYTDEVHLFEHNEKDEFNTATILHLLQSGKAGFLPFCFEGPERTDTTEEEFIQKAQQAIQHCKIGNTFQLVLSRKFEQNFKGDDFQVYRELRRINPSPYLFYFDFGNFRLFGSSPETQLKTKDNYAVVNPIAGTCRKT